MCPPPTSPSVPKPIPSFYSLASDEANAVFPPAQTMRVGKELLRQDDPADQVFLVGRGLVKLMRTLPDGQQAIVGLRGSGWVLGAAAVLIGEPYVITAVTASPSRIATMSATAFQGHLRDSIAFSRAIHRMHAREVYGQLDQLGDFACRSAKDRLALVLRRLAPELPAIGGEIRFETPLKQWEIAQLVGVAPQYLCQLMGDLRNEGRLRRDGQALVLSVS